MENVSISTWKSMFHLLQMKNDNEILQTWPKIKHDKESNWKRTETKDIGESRSYHSFLEGMRYTLKHKMQGSEREREWLGKIPAVRLSEVVKCLE